MKYLPLILIFSLFVYSCSSTPKTYSQSEMIRNMTTSQMTVRQKVIRKASKKKSNYNQADLIKEYSKARQTTY